MDYKKTPGKKLEIYGLLTKKEKPTISIITPYYNSGETITETANSILNQTYPFFEWIIIDDGSKDKKSLKELEKIKAMDKRITVLHKKNEGPSAARDYGIMHSSKETKYIYFLDSDDLIDKTTLECLYWSLETNKDASFAYTSIVNFGSEESIWEKYLTVEQELTENLISVSSLVRKEDLLEVGCFGIKEKAMYEDWNLWLKLIKAKKKPLRVNAPLFWYRKSENGELSRARKNDKNAMKYVKETANSIKEDVEIIQYPRTGNQYAMVEEYNDMVLPDYTKDNRKTVLYIFPWMTVGGADYFNLDLIKRLDSKKYKHIIITTTPNDNPIRQEFEEYADVYDMATFMNRKDYIKFADYLIKSRKVDIVMVSNSEYGYYMVPYLKSKYPTIPFIDYIHCVDITDKRYGFARCSRDVTKYLSHTYCCNNATLRELKEDFGIEKAETIYIGTNEEKFNPKNYNKQELRKKYNVPQDKIIISFVARLADQKRPQMFVEIGKRIHEKNNNVYFVVAGDGELMPEVRPLVNNNFKLLGMVKETDEIYALSDLTLNCSTFEGLALTSYESLAMNVPVISTDAGGQCELIDSTVGATIHFNENPTPEVYNEEINEYVEKTLDVIKNLDKIKKNCREKILKGFTLNIMAKKFDDIFTQSIEEEKNTKLDRINYIDYELGIEAFYIPYYFYTKNYIENKFDIIIDCENQRSKYHNMYKRIAGIFNRFNAKNEAKVVLEFIRSSKHTVASLIRAIIYFFKSIVAITMIMAKIAAKVVKKITSKNN